MKVHVDRAVCERHGQCVNIEPDVFRFDDDGELRYDPEVEAQYEGSAREAVELCPVQAIAITDAEPQG